MISVNGVLIDDDAVAREAQYHPAPSFEAARGQAALALVVRELLLQEARRQGIDHDDGDEESGDEAIRALIAREVTIPEADEETLRRFFENNRERFRMSEVYDAAHILFPALPDDAEARVAARDKAAAAIADIDGDADRFAAIARERSACPSAAQGGALGCVTQGQTAPELETFFAQLEPGTVCPVPVPSRYGYHVLRLAARYGGAPRAFEDAREEVRRHLLASGWQQATRHYLMVLAGRARIVGIALPAAENPLVQ